MSDANKAAEVSLAEEKAKFGFNRPAAKVSNAESEDEEDQDMGDLEDSEEEEKVEDDSDDSDDEEEDKSDDSEDDSDDDSDEEDEEDSEEEEDESSSQSKKGIPFKAHNKLRKELGNTKRLLDEALAREKSLEAKLPDDFQERIDALSKEIGVEDPESLKKIINLVKDVVVDKNVKGLEEKISKLEKAVEEKKASSVVDEFPQEWESFEDTFKREYPNATTEQIKTARQTMRELAGSKKTGGKVYIHPDTGEQALDPYPLGYILFENRSIFDELVTGKKKHGMENQRGRNIRSESNEGEVQHLSKNSSANDIRALDKKYAKMEAGSDDGLRTPENSNI